MTEASAHKRGWIKKKGRGSFTRTADTQYYVWYKDDAPVAYQFHNHRTNQISPVIVSDRAQEYAV